MDKKHEAIPASAPTPAKSRNHSYTSSITPLTPTPTPTDDESITTSTESDTFDTWTLVTDKNKKQKSAQQEHSDRVTIKKTDEQTVSVKEDKAVTSEPIEEEQPKEPIPEHDANVDEELSDGISIISESESGGRISPHPFLRDHLSDLNLKFSVVEGINLPQSFIISSLTDDSLEPISTSQLRQRRQKRSRSRSTSVDTANRKALQPAEATSTLQPTISSTSMIQLPSIARRGLTGLFYLAAAVVVLAFIGKLRHPDWQPLSGDGSSSESIEALTQKLSDMEYQNNLMRAEIDILARQVHYLNTVHKQRTGGREEKQDQEHEPEQGRHKDDAAFKARMFKAWLGNGKALDPVKITKGDLKRPYKCDDGRFVEIAGMCVEQASSDANPPLVDELGNAVHENLQQNPAYQAFENLAEQLQSTFNSNPHQQEFQPDNPRHDNKHHPEIFTDDQQRRKEYRRSGESGSREEVDSNRCGRNGKKCLEKNQHRDDHDRDYDGSQERKGKKHSFNSKERHQHKDSSRERFHEQRKRQHSGEQHKDGHWHEQRMQQREHARRHNDDRQQQRNDKNWYIKRGNSREQMRHGEEKHR